MKNLRYNSSTHSFVGGWCWNFWHNKASHAHLVAKLKQAIPKSSPLKVKVLFALVQSLSPSKKKNIFSDARRELSFTPGRPSKVLQNKDGIIAFLEQPDISYCSPGRKDTAYCGKSNDIKIYCPKHDLLYTYKERSLYLYSTRKMKRGLHTTK